MKKIIFAIVAVTFFATPATVQAEDGASMRAAPAAAERSRPEAQTKRPERPQMSFEERKAKAIERAQKRLSCLQAAQTPEALKACSPRWGGHRGGKMGGKSGGKSDIGQRHMRSRGGSPAPTE